MKQLLLFTLVFFAVAVLYKFRMRIIVALRRFDARNAARRSEEMRDRFDGLAHYRHTLRLAEEKVEAVGEIKVADERTGEPVARYLFLGRQYATRGEAELARRDAVLAKAREFYSELDTLWLGRRWRRESGNAPALPTPQKDSKPPRP